MPNYLLSVHNDGTSPYASDEQMQQAYRDTGALNEEMREAGVWVFAGGLEPAGSAQVVRMRHGALERTDGPHLDSAEHISGFWILDVADLEAAQAWAARATIACQGDVEIRPFQGR